ncbi:MAG: PilZ domain-containing protein [Deltaproteobacteria bacterium]|nr:PilZ domain-containing protein [Deltaproteobacteria bacterium]
MSDVGKPEREHQRYAHEAALTLHSGGKVHHGRTTNVSRGGLCADLAANIPMGTEVELDMQLVFEEDEKSDALRVSATVVWCTTVDDGYQIGLAFRPLNADKTKLINLFLRYLDDGGKPVKAPKGERSIDDQFR